MHGFELQSACLPIQRSTTELQHFSYDHQILPAVFIHEDLFER